MKKLAIVFTSIILLLALVGCGTFSYNIRSYVNVADPKAVSIKQTDIDKEVADAISNLLSNYKGEDEKTEGTIEKDDTAYIYYAGTATVFKGLYSFKMGENSFKGLDEALKDVEFKDGTATVELTLADGFTFPEEIAEAMKAKADAKAAEENTATPTADVTEEPSTEEPTEQPTEEPTEQPTEETVEGGDTDANAALLDDEEPTTANADETQGETPDGETPSAEEPSTEDPTTETTPEDPYKDYNDYFPKKTVKIELKVDGKNGKVEDGETVAANMTITIVFDRGTYNADSEDEKNKTDDERKGYKLTIGSNSFIPGFEDAMIGMSVEKGTKKALDLTFPSPYSTNKALSGMDVIFDVEIQSVTKIYERDLDNAEQFAALKADYEKANGTGSFDYKDKADYEAGVNKNVKASLATDAVVNASKIIKWRYSDLEEYVTSARNSLLNNYIMYYYQWTGTVIQSEDQIVSTFFGGDYQKYSDTYKNTAGQNLKKDWVLYQIAKDNNLDSVSGDEYDTFIEQQLAIANAGVTNEENKYTESTLVDNMGGKSQVKKYIVLDKAQKWLGENVPVV